MFEALTLLTRPLMDLRSASQVMRWYCRQRGASEGAHGMSLGGAASCVQSAGAPACWQL